MGKKFYKTDVFEMKEGQERRVGKVNGGTHDW